jgi:hypothetical protein
MSTSVSTQPRPNAAVRLSGLLLALFAVLLCACSLADAAEWSFAWGRDEGTNEYACTASSGSRRVRTGPGKGETDVRLGIQGEGFVTITSDPVPFDASRIYETWIRVDDQPIIVRLNQSRDGRSLTFVEEDSIALHRQFETGSLVTVALVFAPTGTVITQQFTLEGYPAIVPQYKGCKGLLLNPGWLGLSLTTAPKDDAGAAWVREHTPYQKPGAVIVTVDPRKEAARSDLRPGDRIIAVNGREAEVKDIIAAMKSAAAGGMIELDILRRNERIRKTVVRPPQSDTAE